MKISPLQYLRWLMGEEKQWKKNAFHWLREEFASTQPAVMTSSQPTHDVPYYAICQVAGCFLVTPSLFTRFNVILFIQNVLTLLKVFPKSVTITQLSKMQPQSLNNQYDILQMSKSQESQSSENLSCTNILNFLKAFKVKGKTRALMTGKIFEVVSAAFSVTNYL